MSAKRHLTFLKSTFLLLFFGFFFEGAFAGPCDTMEADLSASAPECTGEGVDFVNTGSSDGAYDYSWDFGTAASPSTSTAENPSGVTYSSAGTKSVTLTITDPSEGCVVSETKGVTIHEEPSASFSSSAPACRGRDVSFSNSGSTGGKWTYSWDFGSDASPNTSSAENPGSISYSSPGTKTVTFTVTDDNGHCSATETKNISIEARPDASISSTAPACTGENLSFANTGSSGAIYAYQWDLGSGASPSTTSAENPSGVKYSSSGNKTARLVIENTNTGCRDTARKDLTVHETPSTGFASTAPACEGTPIDFSNTGASGSKWTYKWDFGSGSSPQTSSAKDPSGVSYDSQGGKTVTQTISSQHCNNTFTATVSVEASPEAAFTHNGPGCTGDTVTFTNTGSTGGTYDHSWDLGASATPSNSSSQDPEGVYSSDGNKQVMLVTENTNTGCTDTAYRTISIHQTPDTGFTSTAPVCEQVPVSFTNTGSSGSQWTYSWDFGNGGMPNNSTAENPSGISYTGAGSKTVTQTITDDNGYCSASSTQTIGIQARPDASFSSTAPECTGDSLSFSNTGSSGAKYSYSWDFGTDASPSTSSMEHPSGISYSSSGNKTVHLVITNTNTGCKDTAFNTHNVYLTPSVSFSSNAPVCSGEALAFQNTGSTGQQWSYDWDLGNGAVPVTSTSEDPGGIHYQKGGMKMVTLTVASSHCQRRDSMSVSIDSVPRVDAGRDTSICADRCAELGTAAKPAHSYSWFPSKTLDSTKTAMPTACPDAQVTRYLLNETDTVSGCSATDSVTVTMVTTAFADAGPDVEICAGDSVQVGSGHIEGQTYRWSPSDSLTNESSSNPFAFPDTSTVYTMNTSYEGCDTITDDVMVTVHPLPDVQVQDGQGNKDSTEITQGSMLQLVASGAVQYEWMPTWGLSDPGVHDPEAAPDSDTLYKVKGTDLHGCVARDSMRINVIEPEVWAPNAFTPNGDGRNDRFFIRGEGVTGFELTVFDRSGRLVFKTENIEQGWDGTVKGSGERLPEGSYVYRASGELSDGERFEEKGMINLIR